MGATRILPHMEGLIEVTSLDSCKIPKVDLIQLDIEGYEPLALLGATETIQRDHPVLMIEEKGSLSSTATSRDGSMVGCGNWVIEWQRQFTGIRYTYGERRCASSLRVRRTKYSYDYVEKLERGLHRHTTYDFDFDCITRSKYPGWWAKMDLSQPKKERSIWILTLLFLGTLISYLSTKVHSAS